MGTILPAEREITPLKHLLSESNRDCSKSLFCHYLHENYIHLAAKIIK